MTIHLRRGTEGFFDAFNIEISCLDLCDGVAFSQCGARLLLDEPATAVVGHLILSSFTVGRFLQSWARAFF